MNGRNVCFVLTHITTEFKIYTANSSHLSSAYETASFATPI